MFRKAVFLVVSGILSVHLFANAGGQNSDDVFSWESVAEYYGPESQFCVVESKEEVPDFDISSDANIILPANLKLPRSGIETEINLKVLRQGEWSLASTAEVYVDPNGMTIDGRLADGFYRITFSGEDINDGNNDLYGIACSDWKKSLSGWCYKNRELIETNADSQLIYSSITASHFNVLMQLINESEELSERILNAIKAAVKARMDFQAGVCPAPAKGLNKLKLRRFEGADIAEFAIHVPQEYCPGRQWPVYLHIDPRRWSEGKYGEADGWNRHVYHKGMLDMWWHTTSHENLRWKDYDFALGILKQKLNIDEDRIYLYGLCNNGIATMALALKYPDRWAECFFSTGNSFRHLVGNAFNLPVKFSNVHPTNDEQAAYVDFAVKCFDYFGCRKFSYSNNPQVFKKHGKLIPGTKRKGTPYRVFNRIESLANNCAYWTRIDGRGDENFAGTLDVIAWGQSILIRTDNVDSYTLDLKRAPLDCNRPVEIIEDGICLEDSVTGPVFTRKGLKYDKTDFIKDKHLHGPVTDVFTDRYAVVWKGNESIQEFAEKLAGSGPCFEDSKLPGGIIKTHNIVFVGKPGESSEFSKIADKLPVVIEDGELAVLDKKFEGDFGAIFIYPNPLNCKKYIAVFSAATDKAGVMLEEAWREIEGDKNSDVGVFQAEGNGIRWLISEKLNTFWDWHKSWEVKLATLEKEYPKWKWNQWAAETLKVIFDSDVVILEDCVTSNQLSNGMITFRDIAGIFNNHWMIKASLIGKQLRDILTVPFRDISSRKIASPVVAGVSLVKQGDMSDVIGLETINDQDIYTVVFPYKALNGSRMGLLLKDYKIEDEGFLVPLLKHYLLKNSPVDLEIELKNIKLSLF